MVTEYLKSIADELAKYNIRTNQLLCGYVETGRLKSHFADVAKLNNISYEESLKYTISKIPLQSFAQPR